MISKRSILGAEAQSSNSLQARRTAGQVTTKPFLFTMTENAQLDQDTIQSEMSSDLAQVVQQKFGNVPMVPGTATKALQIAQNPDCSVTEFANLIETDVKLASEILAHANSVPLCVDQSGD